MESPDELLVGDFVQARRMSEDLSEVSEGIVTAVAVPQITIGGTIFNADEEWTFEVIRRDNTFPDTLCMIDASLYSKPGQIVRLMGMRQVWSTLTGTSVPVTDIRLYTAVDPNAPEPEPEGDTDPPPETEPVYP